MGALSCFKNLSTVPTRSLKLRRRRHSCRKYCMFLFWKPKIAAVWRLKKMKLVVRIPRFV